MNKHVTVFEKINLEIPRHAIYSRLGYRDKTTKVDKQQQEEFSSLIDEAQNYLDLKAVSLRLGIGGIEQTKVKLDQEIIFDSQILASLLENCCEVILFGATSGSSIVDEIKKSAKENLTRSVVFDAAASEITDSVFDWLREYYNQQLKREGKQLTKKRISCGYGDFKLENQSKIYSLLEMDRLGVQIADNFILNPEKSVTAVSGIIG